MADTVTPNLALIKPDIGASSDTWGNKLNGNFDVLDQRTVRQSIQWTITMGDDVPASPSGLWLLSRYGNDGLLIDSPIAVNRQTGMVTAKSLTVQGAATINGALNIPGGIAGILGVTGDLGVTGNAAINGNLGVGGVSTLQSLVVEAAASVGGNLGVAGKTTTATFESTGNATVSGNIIVTGNFNNAIKMPYRAAPAIPPTNIAAVYFDDNGNPVVRRPDGSIAHLGVPPGTIAFTGASTADIGWALLNGQPISRAANPALFERYGTFYGVGNGSTTFNLPDLRGRTIAHVDGGAGVLTAAGLGGNAVLGADGGRDVHLLTIPQLPAHNHTTTEAAHSHVTGARTQAVAEGSSENVDRVAVFPNSASGTTDAVKTNLTVNNAGGGQAHPNVQPTFVLNAQVKLG